MFQKCALSNMVPWRDLVKGTVPGYLITLIRILSGSFLATQADCVLAKKYDFNQLKAITLMP